MTENSVGISLDCATIGGHAIQNWIDRVARRRGWSTSGAAAFDGILAILTSPKSKRSPAAPWWWVELDEPGAEYYTNDDWPEIAVVVRNHQVVTVAAPPVRTADGH